MYFRILKILMHGRNLYLVKAIKKILQTNFKGTFKSFLKGNGYFQISVAKLGHQYFEILL